MPNSIALLRSVFDAMADGGRITLDQLPFVLVGAEVQATAGEIEGAIEQLMPDSDEGDALLDFEQVEVLFHHLLRTTTELHQESDHGEVHVRKSIGSRLAQWWWARKQRQRMNQTAYEKHMRPTTRLLLVILCTSCAISIAIVVVAIVLIWDYSTDNVKDHIKRDVDLMRNGMNLFAWQKPLERYQQDNKRLAALVSLLTDELGYKGSKETMKEVLDFETRTMSGVLDGWYEHDAVSRVSMNSWLVRGWLNLIIQNKNESAAIDMFNNLNSHLPSGHEVVLSKMNTTSNKIIFLTHFRFADQCLNGQCGSDPSGAAPTKAALAGHNGTIFGKDYRPAAVVAGYTYLANNSVGIVYKIDQAQLRSEFEASAIKLVNAGNAFTTNRAASSNSTAYEEITLAKYDSARNATTLLNTLSYCNATCLAKANLESSPVSLAAKNISGLSEMVDLLGFPILTSYDPLDSSGLGLALSIKLADFLVDVLPTFGAAIDQVNNHFPDSKEIQLATFGNTTVDSLTFYTQARFPSGCGTSGCVLNATTCPYVQLAAATCAAGTAASQDYRGEPVVVGFGCSKEIKAVVSMKLDKSQVKAEGVNLTRTIALNQNYVRFKDSSTEFVLVRKAPGVVVPSDARDFLRITPLKHIDDCPNRVCVGFAAHLLRALMGESGVMTGPDYRNVEVIGGYTYVSALDIALVLNVEEKEAQATSVSTALQLAGCSVAAVATSMLLLYLMTNRLLKYMDEAWEEGRRAVQQEKDTFGGVIRAMYPPPVAQRLLAGETRIVYNVGRVSVFFSDIYEFTTASNAITPQELIQFMGYTFGVMDAAAELFHIHKVKTIGDAYLGVAGLPGCSSLTGTICLDMLLFASCCAQLFSSRYIHPEDGDVLNTVHQALFNRKPGAKGSGEPAALARRPSTITYGNPSLPENAAVVVDPSYTPQTQCIMRYGVSDGPVTAGILQGKVPLFDIWGKTVNLASRMESTGQPGRVQVSEGVYHVIIKLKDQPFTFDSRHQVYCKGFGQVHAYFLSTSSTPPPEELLASLGIEPNLGQFHFDNGAVASKAGPVGPDRCSTGKQSTRSSVISDEAFAAQ
eukprot:GGOE01033277.1.p1 GENE.GGOE01033277.1~~GGOE01033277.1.p1  ORF type:complete len:1140 (+),score=364.51 GGOE01033277.1:175-3420(+)